MHVYYSDDQVTLFHGDAREYLAGAPDASMDAVITDPPYSARTHRHAKTNHGKDYAVRAVTFDAMDDDTLVDVLTACGRVTRRWVIATLDYRHAVAVDTTPPPGLRTLRVGVWVKPNPMPQISGDRPGQGWEAIAFMHRTGVKPVWHGGGRSGVWVARAGQREEHPTSKPLSMVADWVRLFTDPGDVVLDPYAGSGTTLRAAKDNGRRAIGVEISERYCDVAARRLSQDVLDLGGCT